MEVVECVAEGAVGAEVVVRLPDSTGGAEGRGGLGGPPDGGTRHQGSRQQAHRGSAQA